MKTASVVRCYSGHTYAQEPQSFTWQGQQCAVATVESVRRVLDTQSGAMTMQFVVVTPEHSRFRLSYADDTDEWTVEAVIPAPSQA